MCRAGWSFDRYGSAGNPAGSCRSNGVRHEENGSPVARPAKTAAEAAATRIQACSGRANTPGSGIGAPGALSGAPAE
jgi:hypothetical protein